MVAHACKTGTQEDHRFEVSMCNILQTLSQKTNWAGRMTQWVKALGTKPDGPSLLLKAHMKARTDS